MNWIALIAYFGISAGIMVVLNHVGSSKWRGSIGQHWSERARLLYPVRTSALLNIYLLAAFAVLGSAVVDVTPHGWPLSALSGLLGAMLGCFPLDRTILPDHSFKTWGYQILLGWGIRAFLYLPLIGLAITVPSHWRWEAVGAATCLAIWQCWFVSSGHMRILGWLNALTPVPSDLKAKLDECFNHTSITPRMVAVLRTPLLGAFAAPISQSLVFTEGLLKHCTPSEIQAICYHELSHLSESRRVRIQRVLSSFVFFPFIFTKPLMDFWGLWGLGLIGLGSWFWQRAAVRLLRHLEVKADQVAVRHEVDPGLYANTLLKLHMLNQTPAVMPRNLIHPHLYDRMLAAGVTPDFPRPRPPKKLNWTTLALYAGLIVSIFYLMSSRRGW